MEKGMKQTVGQRLQAAREAQGLSLQTVSKITKILPEQLAALEQDQYEKIPASTQVRGFVRIYARTLGMDEKPLLDELDNIFGFREEDNHLLISLPVKYVDPSVKKEPFFTPQKIAFFFAFLLFVLMCSIGLYRIYQVTSFRHGPGKTASYEEQIRKSPELKPSILEPLTKEQPTEGSQGNLFQVENMPVKRATPLHPIKLEEKPQEQSLSSTPSSSPPPLPSSPPPSSPSANAEASNTENIKIMRALPVTPEPVPNLEDHPRTKDGEIESDADSADENSAEEPAVSFAEKNYKLVVQARKDSWIFIQVIEGGKAKQVFSGVLHGGEHKEFIGPRFQIRASNISQVEFILDGKSISVASAGESPQDIILPATP
ncbi:helix-turn-helix domain-containing protein [Candidatus Methylacidiphilum infernorum]|nr:helix-turn-helix domain-containing protein [Candidatus Methylacidiphilum infernorum]